MKFEEAVEVILELEGGYVSDPRDAGGETSFGISKKAYPSLDIAGLKREEAIAIYKRDYWDKNNLDRIPEVLRLPLFDCAINQGSYFSISTLQRLLGLIADGHVGPQTVEALIKHKNIDGLREQFFRKRMSAYSTNKLWPVFGAGWANRLLEVALK